MKEIREEAERYRKHKLEKYGADHKACGGKMKAYAHGGHVKHDDEKEDEALIKKEVKSECLKHRDMGGPIAGGGPSRLGRGRKGGKGKGTNVNIAIGKPGGDSPAPIPPALGAGPIPSGPLPMPPKPAAPVIPPRPMPPAGPMKRGGKVHEKHHGKNEKHNAHKHHRHSGHRG